MRCTGNTGKGMRCREPAVTALRWSEEIILGWNITNDRSFCGACKDVAVQRLNDRGITVTLVELSVAPVATT